MPCAREGRSFSKLAWIPSFSHVLLISLDQWYRWKILRMDDLYNLSKAATTPHLHLRASLASLADGGLPPMGPPNRP